jgi:hypothetical protein
MGSGRSRASGRAERKTCQDSQAGCRSDQKISAHGITPPFAAHPAAVTVSFKQTAAGLLAHSVIIFVSFNYIISQKSLFNKKKAPRIKYPGAPGRRVICRLF